ncbi:MAG: NAD(P)/FAD-dependent oxidoreductase [Alphaproteobacteria bacterium]
MKQNIAIIGAGISGLGAAFALYPHHHITLYEQENWLGGHAHTVTTPQGDAVDTGFIVFNQHTYPNFLQLMQHLGVSISKSDMSLAVSLQQQKIEYASDSLRSLFPSVARLIDPLHWKMLLDIPRFYHLANKALKSEKIQHLSLKEWLEQHHLAGVFAQRHLQPLAAAIWSADMNGVNDFPAFTFLQFFKQHGLLNPPNRQFPWFTIHEGSRSYVNTLLATMPQLTLQKKATHISRTPSHITIHNLDGEQHNYDQVIFATHPNQTLKLLTECTPAEQQILQAIHHRTNKVILHQDSSLMPKNRRIWASWNVSDSIINQHQTHYQITYWMNRLQPHLKNKPNYFVTLDPRQPINPKLIIEEYNYAHPQLTQNAINAQNQLPTIQGKNRSWFCGAWTAYGFHEDGLTSGLNVAEKLGAQLPFTPIYPNRATNTP